MTNPDYTHLTLVVDRSGGMGSVADEAQAGVNSLIDEQFAVDGRLSVTLAQFDNEFETVERMGTEPFVFTLRPRGMTALLDAIGMEVTRTGRDLAGLLEGERPGLVLFVVVTDGHENSSHEYTVEQVRSNSTGERRAPNLEVVLRRCRWASLGAPDTAHQLPRADTNGAHSRQAIDVLAPATKLARSLLEVIDLRRRFPRPTELETERLKRSQNATWSAGKVPVNHIANRIQR